MTATCLCVAEGHPYIQYVGYWTYRPETRAWVFVFRDLKDCAVCGGTGISPRARQEQATS